MLYFGVNTLRFINLECRVMTLSIHLYPHVTLVSITILECLLFNFLTHPCCELGQLSWYFHMTSHMGTLGHYSQLSTSLLIIFSLMKGAHMQSSCFPNMLPLYPWVSSIFYENCYWWAPFPSSIIFPRTDKEKINLVHLAKKNPYTK